MELDFLWLYLAIFLLIPLSRIIPRYLRKRMNNRNQETKFTVDTQPQNDNFKSQPQNDVPTTKPQNDVPTKTKPQTARMLVLGALNSGLRTFETIQNDTGIESNKLDEILTKLERDGLLYVHQKQGMLGTKIELRPTEKGFKEYYS